MEIHDNRGNRANFHSRRQTKSRAISSYHLQM